MKTYLISYDLVNPGRDYKTLIEAIKNYGGTWCKPLLSTWVIKTEASATQIRDALTPYLDANDKLLVIRVREDAAWKGLPDDVSNWLRENLAA